MEDLSTDGEAHDHTDGTMGKKNDKAAKSDKADNDEEGGGKKRRTLVIAGLCVALAGAGYMLGGRKAGAQTGAAATTTTIEQLEGCVEGTDAAEVEHRAVDLPAMSINLTDGHFLRVTASLALCPDVVLLEGEEFVTAPAKDVIVATLSGASMTVLEAPEGREQAKDVLTEKIRELYPEEVYEVYLLEFVMQ